MGTFQGDRSSSPQVPSVLIMKAHGFLDLISRDISSSVQLIVFEGSMFFSANIQYPPGFFEAEPGFVSALPWLRGWF